MYVLKIKDGENKGKYVGKKGYRSWDWKAQDDINNARMFSSISGIKNFFGTCYGSKGDKKFVNFRKKYDELFEKFKSLSHTEKINNEEFKEIRKNYSIELEEYKLSYEDRYELVELEVKIKS